MALGLFRTIAAVGRDMVVSSTFGTFILVVVFVCGGFVVSRGVILQTSSVLKFDTYEQNSSKSMMSFCQITFQFGAFGDSGAHH